MYELFINIAFKNTCLVDISINIQGDHRNVRHLLSQKMFILPGICFVGHFYEPSNSKKLHFHEFLSPLSWWVK